MYTFPCGYVSVCVNGSLCELVKLCMHFTDCRVHQWWLIAHWARYQADPLLSRVMSGALMIGAPDYSLHWTSDQLSLEALPSWA